MGYSLSGFSVHGIYQARMLEWAAISFCRGSSWPRVDSLPLNQLGNPYPHMLYDKKKRLQWLQNNALSPGQSKVRSLASKEMDSYHAESVIKRWATETWLIKMKRRNQGLFPSGWQELQGRGVKSALCWKEELGKKREISIQHKTSSILDILNLEIPVRHPSGAIE